MSADRGTLEIQFPSQQYLRPLNVIRKRSVPLLLFLLNLFFPRAKSLSICLVVSLSWLVSLDSSSFWEFCRISLQVNLEGAEWRQDVVETLRKEGNLAEVAISPETHFQFGVSNPTFYFVEFYLKKTSISISYSNLPKYMCFSLNWTNEASMQVVHQNPLIFSELAACFVLIDCFEFHP